MKKIKLKLLVLATLSVSNFTYASLINQPNQDAAGLGEAQAGSAALADDASTEYYNPAGLVRMTQQEMVIGGNLIMPTYNYSGDSSTTSGASTTTASGSEQGGQFYGYPYLHYAAPISPKWVFGFGVSSPFSTNTEWSSDSVMSNMSTKSKLETYDITTDLAYAINSRWSVGAGFDYVRTILSENNKQQLNGSSTDNFSSSAYSWDNGYHIGVLFQLDDKNRVGLNYHSKVTFTAAGRATVKDSSGTTLSTSDEYKVKDAYPAQTVLSYFRQINPKWVGLASLTYTEWDQFSDMQYINEPDGDGGTATSTQDLGLQNNWETDLGLRYIFNENVQIHSGVGYESSPTKDDSYYAQAPDFGAYIASLGLHVKTSVDFAFDLGWTHYFYIDHSVNTESQYDQGTGTTLSGDADGSSDIFGLQMVWDMG